MRTKFEIPTFSSSTSCNATEIEKPQKIVPPKEDIKTQLQEKRQKVKELTQIKKLKKLNRQSIKFKKARIQLHLEKSRREIKEKDVQVSKFVAQKVKYQKLYHKQLQGKKKNMRSRKK